MGLRTSSLLLGSLLVLGLVGAGCSDSDDPVDAGSGNPDATVRDSGTVPDSGSTTPDTGVVPDGGPAPDSGVVPDAGEPTPDSGVTPTAEFPQLFVDDYTSGMTFADFGGATNAITVDTSEKHSGTASLRIAVPAGGYTGGAIKGGTLQDLSSYDALTFWAKADAPHALNVAGFGNNASSAVHQVEWNAISLGTTWAKYIIPIPAPSKVTAEDGLFHFAEGSDEGAYTMWIDDLQYERVGAGVLGDVSPAIATETVNRAVGDTYAINGSSATYTIDGVARTLALARSWMSWSTSDAAVATVSAEGIATGVAPGTAVITASLGTTAAVGATTINVTSPNVPAVAAPTPSVTGDVVSLYSNAFTNNAVDTWSASWDSADVADVQIAGDDAKRYSNLVFAGIEFTSAQVNATPFDRFHMDIWTPDCTTFGVKLVDFGANGAFGGGDDTEHQLNFDGASSPAIVNAQWISIDVPLSAFAGLAARSHLAQMIIVGNNAGTVYVDNVYFYTGAAAPTAPTTAAPTPTEAQGDVISLFSNAYTNVAVDTWSAVWDAADVADAQVAGNDVKVYSNLAFAGIELTSAPVDASGMGYFHMDVWTANVTSFGVKLVDFGANASFGGGDDTEHQLNFDAASAPALVTGQWVSLELPLASFTGLAARAHIAQLIIVGNNGGTVYVDNVYFHTGSAAPTAPTTAAPTPSAAAGDAISLFSNAYTNVTVDTWSASWDGADVADAQVAGNDVKVYSNLVFAGIEFTSAPVDATAMTHFHIDVWTASSTTFGVKLVDFGANGTFAGGDDTEFQLDFGPASSPVLASGTWVSLDLPLSAFTGLAARAHVAQMILVANNNGTVFVDNVYFHR